MTHTHACTRTHTHAHTRTLTHANARGGGPYWAVRDIHTELGSAVVCVSMHYVLDKYTKAFFTTESAEMIVKYVYSQGTYVAKYLQARVA